MSDGRGAISDGSRYEFRLSLNEEKASSYLARMVGANKKVLEIGCATGSVTRLLKDDLECTVTGIEIDAFAAKKAQAICDELVIGDIENMDYGSAFHGRTFDVITFGDVLEHLRDPLATLRRVKPLLEDGGYVVASVPNIAHAAVAFEIANGRFDYRRLGLLDETHIRFFTKRSLLAMFEEAGYIVTELRRDQCHPAETEFHTAIIDPADRAVMDYFYRRNPESQTYQFVLKAVPTESSPSVLNSGALLARERIEALEREMQTQAQELRHLKSQVSWLDSRWPRNWVKRLAATIRRSAPRSP